MQYSKCVIATASHNQACSCQSPESLRAMFQSCHSYGLALTSSFLPVARKPSCKCFNAVNAMASHDQTCSCQSPESPPCNVPIVSLLRLRINKPVLANRQTALVQCSNCVTATALQNPTCSCQSPESASCNVPNVSLPWPRIHKLVLANRQKALVQCFNCVIPTASHEQTCSCQSPESLSYNIPNVSLLRPRISKLVFANRQTALVQCSNCLTATATHKQTCFLPIARQPSCSVPTVSLLRPRINKLVLASRQKSFVQCSNCVIAMVSHEQACTCQPPEGPREMFQLCHCCGLAETNLFLPIARMPSCNVPSVSLLRPRIIKPVLANRQKARVQCSNCVIAWASHDQTCSWQSPESPSCNVPLVSLLRPRISNLFLPIARKPSCNVLFVTLLRRRINKPVLATRQKALVQCSNRVIATASHKQACSCQSPESLRAMFQLCHCYGLP